jgi:hypothetical protein
MKVNDNNNCLTAGGSLITERSILCLLDIVTQVLKAEEICVGVLVICILIFAVFCIACTVLFALFLLCIFILICFVGTSVKDYCHRVTNQLQLVIIIKI